MSDEKIKDPVALVEESAGKKILQALITELRLESPRFASHVPEKQQEVIDRLRSQVEAVVNEAVLGIAARAFTAVNATVESLTFKDGAKLVLTLQRTGDGVHQLADAVGGSVMVVLASSEEFVGGMHQVKPVSPQRDLLDGDSKAA